MSDTIHLYPEREIRQSMRHRFAHAHDRYLKPTYKPIDQVRTGFERIWFLFTLPTLLFGGFLCYVRNSDSKSSTGNPQVAFTSPNPPTTNIPHTPINDDDKATSDKPEKETALIRRRDDGKVVFSVDGRLFVQDPSKSYEFTHLVDLPATVQLLDGMNYRIDFSSKSKETALIKASKNLKKFNTFVAVRAFACKGVTNEVLRALSDNPNIVEIGLDNSTNYDDEGLAALSKSKNLRRLGIYGANVTGEGIRKLLHECRTIQVIGIEGIRLTPEFVEQLHKEYEGQVTIHHPLIK